MDEPDREDTTEGLSQVAPQRDSSSGSSTAASNARLLAIRALRELDLFVIVSQSGLGFAQVAQEWDQTIGEIRKRVDHDPMVKARRDAELKELENFGHRQSEKGFPYMHGLAAIRLVTILEDYVGSLLTQRLLSIPPAEWGARTRSIRGPLLAFIGMTPDEQVEHIVTRIQDDVVGPERSGIGRFESALAEVGLSGSVEDEFKKAILELLEVRNVLVHRNGVADRRLVSMCPWLDCSRGDRVYVTSGMFRRWWVASQGYVFQLGVRVVRVLGTDEDVAGFDQGIVLSVEALKKLGSPSIV